MQQRFAFPVSITTGKPLSHCRHVLRYLREAGFVPGAGVTPSSRHIARIVMSLASDTALGAVGAVSALRMLPLRSPAELPGRFEDALAQIVDRLPSSPVVGDLDIDGGALHFGPSSVTLEALSLTGKRAIAVYGEPVDGIERKTTIPISTIRALADAIARTQP